MLGSGSTRDKTSPDTTQQSKIIQLSSNVNLIRNYMKPMLALLILCMYVFVAHCTYIGCIHTSHVVCTYINLHM
jgi:hypothetical protein